MSFKERIIEAGMSLSQEGDCVDVAPEQVVPKLYRVCRAAEEALKADGVSVVWDSSKLCAVLCKGNPAPAPAPAPAPVPVEDDCCDEAECECPVDSQEKNRFLSWDLDDKKED